MKPAFSTPEPSQALARAFVQSVDDSLDAWLQRALEGAKDSLATPAAEPAARAGSDARSTALRLLQQRRAELKAELQWALRARVRVNLQARWANEAGSSERAAPVADSATAAEGSLSLTLISEAQIDDEIETARLVLLIDGKAESELQELAALCSGLFGLSCVEPAAVLLRPADCAQALREGIGKFTADAGPRTVLLRVVGQAVGEQMKPVYAAQIDWLRQHGVQAAGFRIVPTAGGKRAPPQADTALVQATSEAGPPEPALSMRELVQWARQMQSNLPTGGVADEGSTELRLFSDPTRFDRDEAPLTRNAAQQLMQGLFGELRHQAGQSATMGGYMRRLEQVAERLARADPALWEDPAHPWWQLLDRVLDSGAVHDDLAAPEQQLLQRSLEQVVNRVETSANVSEPGCQSAANELQIVTSSLLEHAAAPAAEEVKELERLADREELEASFRHQIVQQLHSTPTSGALRRFFVGPWTLAMVAFAQQSGTQAAEVADAAQLVDDLIRATARPGQGVSKAQRSVLLRQVGAGLARAGLQAQRVDAELLELAEILRNPPPHPEAPAQDSFESEAALPSMPMSLDFHAGLPTVPLALSPHADGGNERATAAEWAAGLRSGTCCRLFLQGRWMTARLKWVSPGQRLFMFQSRHGGRSHSLTQRMLCKLREAGLATHVDNNLIRAQAMESLARNTVI